MIVICFPGGAGGHFLGYVIQTLLNQKLSDSAAQANFHQLFCADQSFLNFSFLDTQQHSAEEECCYIEQISTNSDIVLGHFRNLDAIQQKHNCQIVCVKIAPQDHELLVRRVLREAIDHNFSGIKYQDIRGEHWPERNPGFVNLPRWIQLEIESQLYKMFYFWNDQIKHTSTDVCWLTTAEVFRGDIVTKLADYLQLPIVPGLEKLHKDYQRLVQQKYQLD